jgi:hypothetical protein
MWRQTRLAMGVVAALAAVALTSTISLANGRPCRNAGCTTCSSHCIGYETVEKTILVPTTVTELRTVQVVECRPEVQQRTITTYKNVPETKAVTRHYTVMVPEQHSRTETYTVCTPVWKEVTQQYVVSVPHQETKHGVRSVCRPVQVQETRTVCEDHGHWEEHACPGPCYDRACLRCCQRGCCCICGGTSAHKVWVPQVVKKDVLVTVCRNELVQEPYDYVVTVCKPETKTRQVKVCDYVREQKSREVTYTVCVPKTETKTENVTTYKCVAEPKVVNVTVMVPHTVEKQIPVQVCRMIPKQVVCKVPIYAPCGSCCGGCR